MAWCLAVAALVLAAGGAAAWAAALALCWLLVLDAGHSTINGVRCLWGAAVCTLGGGARGAAAVATLGGGAGGADATLGAAGVTLGAGTVSGLPLCRFARLLVAFAAVLFCAASCTLGACLASV